MRYSSVLDHRVDIRRWIESPGGARGVYTRIAEYINYSDAPSLDALLAHSDFAQENMLFGAVYGEALARSIPYWVSPPICDLLFQSADSLPEWTYTPDLFPTKSGFLWYEKPREINDGAKMHGFSWQLAPGFSGDDVKLVRIMPEDVEPPAGDKPLGTVAIIVFYAGHKAADWHVEPTGLSVITPGTTLEKILTPQGDERRCVMNEASFSQKVRTMGATLLFMNQRVVVSRETVPDRATRRRFEREQKQTAPQIQVIMLRREEHKGQSGPSLDHREVEWQCQWMVRGHWRQQPFGPGRSMVRPQWITPYWKGPEDKPVKVDSVKIGALVR